MPFFQRIKEIFTGHHDEEAAHDDAVTDQRASIEKEADTPKQELQPKKAEAAESHRPRGYLGSFMDGDHNKDFDRRELRHAKHEPVIYEKRRPTHGNQIERLM
jgi:hypothetical protein